MLRRLARRWVPFRLRLRIALARRAFRDARSGIRFAAAKGNRADWTHEVSRYSLPFIDYPGQEQLAAAKRHNQRLLAEALDGTVIAPGETLSLWRLAGAPTARRGYAEGAALKNGVLTSEVGGATCLLSTVLYNAALLGGMEIVERRNHSVDTYGDARYYILGRDATIEYGYLDLRFRNTHSHPVLVSVDVDHASTTIAMRAQVERRFSVEIEVTSPQPSRLPEHREAVSVRTTRHIRWASGAVQHDDLGSSSYRV